MRYFDHLFFMSWAHRLTHTKLKYNTNATKIPLILDAIHIQTVDLVVQKMTTAPLRPQPPTQLVSLKML